mgnify:CR=1 FL=1
MEMSANALGRAMPMPVTNRHAVLERRILPPFPESFEEAVFGMGCFWGVERLFWQMPGVWTTAAGYAGGVTPNPTYEEVCSGRTGHAEVVRVIFDSATLDYETLLTAFWEHHDPTQGARQGNDMGAQYRSLIVTGSKARKQVAEASRARYAQALSTRGLGPITTEILVAAPFYYAEDYHQQYLEKNPAGYCGLKGTGVVCVSAGVG